MYKKISIIIQARMSSSRLPGKIFKNLNDKITLEHCIDRLKRCKNVNNIIIATTTNSRDDIIADFCSQKNYLFYRGSENNVLDRYYQTALISNTDIIVRITSDCPLIDPDIVDDMIKCYLKLNVKHYGMKYANGGHTFPDGFNLEIFTFEALKEAQFNSLPNEREHVSTYLIKKYDFDKYEVKLEKDYKNLDLKKLHLSLDTEDDYELLQNIFNNVYTKNNEFTIYDILDYLNNNPNILINNKN